MVTLYKKEVTRLKDLSAAGDKKILELKKLSYKNEKSTRFFYEAAMGRPLEEVSMAKKTERTGPYGVCSMRSRAIATVIMVRNS